MRARGQISITTLENGKGIVAMKAKNAFTTSQLDSYSNIGNHTWTVVEIGNAEVGMNADIYVDNTETKGYRIMHGEILVIHESTKQVEIYLTGYTDGGAAGKDGENAFLLDIDNEMTSIPISSDGKVQQQIVLSFGLSCFYGTHDVTSECAISLEGSAPSGFSVNVSVKSAPVITIAANTIPSEITELTFKAVHSSYGTRLAVFSIASVKSGGQGQDAEIQELLPSLSQISFARNADNTLTPSSRTLTVKIKKTKGSQTSEQTIDASGLTVRYSNNGMPQSASGGVAFTDSGITISSGTTSTNVYIAAFNSAGTLVDRETIPIIKDGKKGKDGTTPTIGENGNWIINGQQTDLPSKGDDGNPPRINEETNTWEEWDADAIPPQYKDTGIKAKGENGADSFSMQIDNEMTSIPVSSEGKVESEKTLSFGLSCYYGTKDITSECTITKSTLPSGFSVNLSDKSNPVVTIAKDTIPAEITEITFTATHSKYGSRSAVFSIAVVKSGGMGQDAELWQLSPSMSNISFKRDTDGVTLTPASQTIACNIIHTKGVNAEVKTIAASGLNVRYSYYSTPNADGGTVFPASGLTIQSNTTYQKIHIAAYNSAGTLVDIETISIIKDGEKGDTGEKGNSYVKINTNERNFTFAQWQTYGANGHSENWSYDNTIYDNSHIKVGDTAYIVGFITDRYEDDSVKASARIEGIVTAVSSTRVTMKSTQLITSGFKGESGSSGYTYRPRGEYVENPIVPYTFDNNFRDYVSRKNGTAIEYYAVKDKGTSPSGTFNPALWEKFNNFNLIASDFVLSNQVQTKIMQAVQARVDELIVSQMTAVIGNTKKMGLNEGGNGSFCQYYDSGNIKLLIADGVITSYKDDANHTINWWIGNDPNFNSSVRDEIFYTEAPMRSTDANGTGVKVRGALTGTTYYCCSTTTRPSYNGVYVNSSWNRQYYPTNSSYYIPDGYYVHANRSAKIVDDSVEPKIYEREILQFSGGKQIASTYVQFSV